MTREHLDQSMTVLIADASRSNRVMLRRRLERLGYFCLSAETGSQVIGLLRETQIAVVLMDMKFPDYDGNHLIRRICRQPIARRPLIIAVTACTMPGDRQRSLECGCDGYIPKPVVLPQLIGLMHKLLQSDDDPQRRIA